MRSIASRRTEDLPLADYGLIGDGRTAALVARDGSIDWLCQGRFDGPAVFCRLLDRQRGGFFQVAPAGAFESTWQYRGRTNVLETEFATDGGRARLTDFMLLEGPSAPTLVRRLEQLCTGGLVRRYTGDDGVQGSEGAFVACSFWLVECLARQGRVEQARGIFESVLSHANDLGLLAEEICIRTGRLLGNHPQALTHLALIRAGVVLATAESARR